MKEVEKYIYKQVAEKQLNKDSAKQMLLEVNGTESQKKHKDMAIIGLACRLPGADNPEEFWNNMKNGKNCVGKFPQERLNEWLDIYTNKVIYQFLFGLDKPEKKEDVMKNTTVGGFLKDVSQFDSSFFGISPKEAKFMSPEQKLMLKVAWESIEDAGYGGDKIYGTNTGVFIGKENSNIGLYKYLTEPDVMHVTGSWNGIIASRISYLYNLKGPSMIVDCACSSGLVSLHMASQAISNGECEMAIVGGIQLQFIVEVSDYDMSLSMVQSDSGIVRTFDKNANGTVWSEGIVSYVVKDLDAALRDGDNIHAVIKGSAINNDGASNGITAPDAKAQEAVISKAWKESGIDPETISYFEAHGTGTILGDPIEIKGLTNAFRKFTDKKQFCAIGATKANLGHTVATSGLAGLLKIIYAMKHKLLPPSINFTEVNPYIDFMNSPVYLNDTLKEWKPDCGVLRAGINSFGFSGTNCHVVLEEPPKRKHEAADSIERTLFLSAKSEASLTNLCKRYIKYLGQDTDATLDEICYTANTGRGQYTHRAAIICTDKESLKQNIKTAYYCLKNHKNTSQENVFIGFHRVVSAEGIIGENEITESQKYSLTNSLSSIVKEKNEKRKEICKLFVQGADINFDEYYKDKKFTKVSVPTYAYDDKRCFASPKIFDTSEPEKKVERNMKHPLFDRMLADSMNTTIYETDFSIDRHWILKEHVFMGTSVIPGTSYIEMAREVCQRYFKTEYIELQNLIFLFPISVKKDETVTVQTILEKTEHGVDFTICSKNKDGKWITHAKGKGVKGREKKQLYNVSELEKRLNINQDERYSKKEEGDRAASDFFEFGGRWKNITSIYGDERMIAEVLVKQELPDCYAEDLDSFYLHPALIDNAINTEISMLQGAYLPFVYKSIKIYRKTGRKLNSHIIRKNPEVDNPETANYDVVLFDEEGNIVAEVDSYSIKRMSPGEQKKFLSKNSNRVSYYHNVWKMDTEKAASEELPSFKDENILILEDEGKKAEAIAEVLKQQGANTITVKPGDNYHKVSEQEYVSGTSMEDYLSLFQQVKDKHVTRIIHCLGCDCYKEDKTIDEKLDKGLFSMFNLSKALLQSKLAPEVSIDVVCRFANLVNGKEPFVYAENNALIAMARCVGAEYAYFKTTCADIDDETDYRSILPVFKENTKTHVAFRNNVRYFEELERYPEDNIVHDTVQIKENGTYVITGGSGALGLEVAKYMASEAKVNLILLNRTKLPDRKYWMDIINDNTDGRLVNKLKKFKEIEDLGSHVYPYGVDISEEDEITSVIADVKNKFGTIHGIVQAAGVAGNGFILNKSRYVFDKVVKPKIYGTILLDKLTWDMDVDFMVNFSSVAASLPSPGQSDYTAANAFLNSFGDSRNQRGKCTKVIAWPAWKEIGMAADNKFRNDDNIFKEIETKRAMEAFDDILKSNIQQVIPADINLKVAAKNQNVSSLRLANELLDGVTFEEIEDGSNASESKKKSEFSVKLSGRGTKYSETEKKVASVWGEVLDINEINIFDSFSALGGDSILASQIYSKMQNVFPGVTDITDIFTYNTISSFAEFIVGKLGVEENVETEVEAKDNTASKREAENKEICNLIGDFKKGKIKLNGVLDELMNIVEKR